MSQKLGASTEVLDIDGCGAVRPRGVAGGSEGFREKSEGRGLRCAEIPGLRRAEIPRATIPLADFTLSVATRSPLLGRPRIGTRRRRDAVGYNFGERLDNG